MCDGDDLNDWCAAYNLHADCLNSQIARTIYLLALSRGPFESDLRTAISKPCISCKNALALCRCV